MKMLVSSSRQYLFLPNRSIQVGCPLLAADKTRNRNSVWYLFLVIVLLIQIKEPFCLFNPFYTLSFLIWFCWLFFSICWHTCYWVNFFRIICWAGYNLGYGPSCSWHKISWGVWRKTKETDGGNKTKWWSRGCRRSYSCNKHIKTYPCKGSTAGILVSKWIVVEDIIFLPMDLCRFNA